MNKFFEFNLNVELGEVFNECTAYQISIEYLNRALDISNNLPINKYRLVKAYELRGKSKMFLKKCCNKGLIFFEKFPKSSVF